MKEGNIDDPPLDWNSGFSPSDVRFYIFEHLASIRRDLWALTKGKDIPSEYKCKEWVARNWLSLIELLSLDDDLQLEWDE